MVTLGYVKSSDQLANLLTKNLENAKFVAMRDTMVVFGPWPGGFCFELIVDELILCSDGELHFLPALSGE